MILLPHLMSELMRTRCCRYNVTSYHKSSICQEPPWYDTKNHQRGRDVVSITQPLITKVWFANNRHDATQIYLIICLFVTPWICLMTWLDFVLHELLGDTLNHSLDLDAMCESFAWMDTWVNKEETCKYVLTSYYKGLYYLEPTWCDMDPLDDMLAWHY